MSRDASFEKLLKELVIGKTKIEELAASKMREEELLVELADRLPSLSLNQCPSHREKCVALLGRCYA